MTLPVFLSYAPENGGLRQQLVRHLTPLVNRGVIRLLESPDAGSIADEEVEAQLAEAKIVLLLITSEFFGSASFRRDWQPVVLRMKKGDVKIRPLLLTPVRWQGQKIGDAELEQLKPLPDKERFVFANGDADSRLAEIALGVEKQVEDMSGRAAFSKPAGRTDPVEEALDTVTRSLSRSNVVFFFGSTGTSVENDSPPRPFEVAKQLLSRLDLIGEDYDQLLPPPDVAAALFAASRSPSGLLNTVDDIYRLRARVPPLHSGFADLLKGIIESRRARKGLIDEPQVIVTTAVDASLELALLTHGISFSRVVQHWSADKLTVNQYVGVKLATGDDGSETCLASGMAPGDLRSWEEPLEDTGGLMRLILGCGRFDVEHDKPTPQIGDRAWSERPAPYDAGGVSRYTSSNAMAELNIKRLQQPVLYKLRGSLDLRNSMALSTDQYIELVLKATVGQRVPKEIAQQVANNIALFLGFSVLDSDFRLTYGLFREQIIKGHEDNYERYMVQLPPAQDEDDSYRKMEHSYWSDVVAFALEHRKVKTLQVAPTEFVERIAKRLAVA